MSTSTRGGAGRSIAMVLLALTFSIATTRARGAQPGVQWDQDVWMMAVP